jgi:hypothetical protein
VMAIVHLDLCPGELNMKKLTDGRRTMAIPHMALWVR